MARQVELPLKSITLDLGNVHIDVYKRQEVNNPDGEMTYFPLHDESSNFYADAEDMNDCTVAKLDGSEGDWMMYCLLYTSVFRPAAVCSRRT